MGRNLYYYRAFGTDKFNAKWSKGRVFFVFLNYNLTSAADHASKVFSQYGYQYNSVERLPAAKGKALCGTSPLFKPVDIRH